MNFRDWLFTEGQNIRFTAWWNDGTVVVYIDQTRYAFRIDAVYHRKLQQMARYKPWTALNKIKEMIKSGVATQIEPAPEPPKPVQGTLF